MVGKRVNVFRGARSMTKIKKSRNDDWLEDKKNIFKLYPHLQDVEFNKNLFYQDPSFMAKIINDILKFDSGSSVSGRRTPLTLTKARQELNSFMGDDYSLDDFVTTFKRLEGNLSVRRVSALS